MVFRTSKIYILNNIAHTYNLKGDKINPIYYFKLKEKYVIKKLKKILKMNYENLNSLKMFIVFIIMNLCELILVMETNIM